MSCPNCQRSNETHRRYCGECGARLTITCGRCSFVNGIADNFCGGCAERLATSIPKLEIVKSSDAGNVRKPNASGSQLSNSDIEELLTVREARFRTTFPSKVTQDDLDKLFSKP